MSRVRTRPRMKTFQEFRVYYLYYGATGFTIHRKYKEYVASYQSYIETYSIPKETP